MSASSDSGPGPGGSDPDLVGLVDELIAQLQAGEPIDLEAVARQDPVRAEQIRRLLPTLEMLADMGQSAAEDTTRLEPPALHRGPGPRVLGDYRIVREVGRGGMGIVYEARQISLGRRVALKVLPFAAAIDPGLLQRFRLEAQAAALLNHPNIVPVIAVGCERQVHFYTMQFIEGRTLAELIRDLRRLAGSEATGPATSADGDFALAGRWASGDFVPPRPGPDGELPTTVQVAPDSTRPDPGSPTDVPPAGRAPDSSLGSSTRTSAFFRTVAHLGIQAADALEYAHEQGVVHRDIKPSNLLIDHRGNLWITDFGLARLHDEGGLTTTGDLLGTLRYMSPEQAAGDRLAIDHRTDVYSLGVTLYELLTLEPAIRGGDRRQVLRRVLEEEPRPAQRLNPSVPRDLATIVGKASAKDARDRYGSARELADDLRRFLEHRPIAARAPSSLDWVAKWARRHSTAVATAAVFLVLAVAAMAVGTLRLARERDRAKANAARAEANAARAEANAARAEANAARAVISEARAEDLIGFTRLEARDFEDARSCFEAARAIWIRLDEAHPGDFDIRLGRARNLRYFGMLHRDGGDAAAAERSLRDSIAILEVLAEEIPHRWSTGDLGMTYETLGRILLNLKRRDEAHECFARTTALQRRFIDRNPDDVAIRELAVVTQVYCPFPDLRNPRWAVEQAEKVRDRRSESSGSWSLLGLAYYRRGEEGGGDADWEKATAALEQATALRKGGGLAAHSNPGSDAHDDFVLAMAYARLRRKDENPVAYYDRAAAWMDQYRPQDLGLQLLRAEAAELLGLPRPPAR